MASSFLLYFPLVVTLNFIFFALRVTFAPFLPIPFHKTRGYVGAWPDGGINCTINIPSHDVWRVCGFTYTTYSVADLVLTVVLHISFGAFRGVGSCVVVDFASCSSDTRTSRRGASLVPLRKFVAE